MLSMKDLARLRTKQVALARAVRMGEGARRAGEVLWINILVFEVAELRLSVLGPTIGLLFNHENEC